MTIPDPQNPMPEPQSDPLRTADAAKGDAEYWEIGGGGGAAPAGPELSTDATTGHPAAWSIPKRENRRRTGVHLDIYPKAAAKEESGAAPIPARRVEHEFGNLEMPIQIEAPHSTADSINEEPSAIPVELGGQIPTTIDASSGLIAEDSEEKTSGPARTESVRVPLKATELASLVVLGCMLLALGVGAYFWSIRLLPEKTPSWKRVDFPVKGARIEIKNAVTYWRPPVLEGPDKDPIRRGTLLIPVVDLELSGGPAAVRVIFRDNEGGSIGDPVLRSVPTSGVLSLACTAGFEDVGMYAAYRTGDLEPWSVEISEAESIDSPGSGYSRILKMNVSTEQR